MKTSIEIAKSHNEHTASLKDSQLYLSRNGVALRALAKDAIINPIIGTAKEVGDRFGHLLPDYNWDKVADHEPDEVFVWCFIAVRPSYRNTRKHNINIACIGKVYE